MTRCGVQIYVMRHGDAVDPDDPGVTSDASRKLTDVGRDETRVMGRLLARLGVTPDIVLSSPFVRSRETAEIVASAVGCAVAPTISEELRYGGSLAGVLDDLLAHGRPRQAILVGHMPSVGRLVGYLTWHQPDTVVTFQTAAICRVDVSGDDPAPGSGNLRWLITPETARRLLV